MNRLDTAKMAEAEQSPRLPTSRLVGVDHRYSNGSGVAAALPELPTPKRSASHFEWYPYYAGFSLDFAKALLSALDLRRGSMVLDPWAGGATTGVAALLLGHHPVMLDVSPAMTVVARAQLLLTCGADPFAALDAVLSSSCGVSPLPDTLAAYGKRLSASVSAGSDWRAALDGASEDDILVCAAAMSVIRRRARRAVGSNPTWIKSSVAELLRQGTDTQLAFDLGRAAQAMRAAPTAVGRTAARRFVAECATSVALDIPDGVVDCVLTSPPYCTRIDYAMLTKPELEFLGIVGADFRALRRSMTGTPMMLRSGERTISTPSVAVLLDTIENHQSYASGVYYGPFYRQYFESLESSIGQIARVLRPFGHAALVVQPSHFKDVVVDLPTLVGDIGAGFGLRAVEVRSWPARDMRQLNMRSRRYGSLRRLSESLVILRREG